MSDIDAKLNLHAGGCGVYQDRPCSCLSAPAKVELAQLRRAVEALRLLAYTQKETVYEAQRRILTARAILAEIDGKEAPDV